MFLTDLLNLLPPARKPPALPEGRSSLLPKQYRYSHRSDRAALRGQQIALPNGKTRVVFRLVLRQKLWSYQHLDDH